MHHDNYHSNNYIIPPLINFLLSYVTLIHYGLVSSSVHDDGTDGSTSWSENFLMVFGTPTLLWRVLHFEGYHEPPLYQWNEVYLERLEPAA